jgi:glycolate dehydrogenase iron-sulfur subunit
MAKLKQLEDYRDEIEQCVKCGACRAHCPVFGAEKHEGRVARGKVALAGALLDGEIDLQPKVLEDMSQCLLCASCWDQCPNKVPTDEIVAAARRRIAEKKGLSIFGLGVTTVLGHPKVMNVLAKAGGTLSSLLFKQLPENSGLKLRFPAPYITSDRTLPPVVAKPFRERVPEHIPGQENAPTVLFFTGCGINYMYPEVGEALVGAMKFLGVNLIIPKDQACCGLPAVSAGSEKTVSQLAQQNLEALGQHDCDYIVTACASCHGGIGKIYAGLGDDYRKLSAKVIDVFEFLVEQRLPEQLAKLPQKEQKLRVTYHDPCHLRTEGITQAPRQILASLPQVDFVEMEGAGSCCGLGGTYSVYHYDTSKKIGAKKAASMAACNADAVATACPGCMMQLQDSINHADQSQQTLHILDLLREALAHQPVID